MTTPQTIRGLFDASLRDNGCCFSGAENSIERSIGLSPRGDRRTGADLDNRAARQGMITLAPPRPHPAFDNYRAGMIIRREFSMRAMPSSFRSVNPRPRAADKVAPRIHAQLSMKNSTSNGFETLGKDRRE